MKLVALFIVLFTSMALHARELNILFIGNSFTFMNDMPYMFEKIAKTNGKKVNVEQLTEGGKDWKFHVRNETFAKLDEQDWDYVILQAKSWEPTQGRRRVDRNTLPYGQDLVNAVRERNSNAKILLYMTWGYKNGMSNNRSSNTFYKMYEVLKTEYLYFADTYETAVAPVGEVWKNVRETIPQAELYIEDNFHPSLTGSYISAVTFYATIFRDKTDDLDTYVPVGLSKEIALKIREISYGTTLNPEEDWRYYNLPLSYKPNIAYQFKDDELLLVSDSYLTEKVKWIVNGDVVSNKEVFSYPISGLNKVKIKLVVSHKGKVYSKKIKLRI